MTRKTLDVSAASVREFCNYSSLLADSNAEALEVDRLVTEFINLFFFQRATRLGKARNCWEASSSSFRLSRSWTESTGSELPSPQRMKKGVSEFF